MTEEPCSGFSIGGLTACSQAVIKPLLIPTKGGDLMSKELWIQSVITTAMVVVVMHVVAWIF